MVVEDHEVFASENGSDRETTCLVRGDLASYFDGLQEFHFGSNAGFRKGNRRRRHLWRIVVYGRSGGNLGGTNISLLLAKMSLDGCERLGEMLAGELRGESGPISVIACVYVLCPC